MHTGCNFLPNGLQLFFPARRIGHDPHRHRGSYGDPPADTERQKPARQRFRTAVFRSCRMWFGGSSPFRWADSSPGQSVPYCPRRGGVRANGRWRSCPVRFLCTPDNNVRRPFAGLGGAVCTENRVRAPFGPWGVLPDAARCVSGKGCRLSAPGLRRRVSASNRMATGCKNPLLSGRGFIGSALPAQAGAKINNSPFWVRNRLADVCMRGTSWGLPKPCTRSRSCGIATIFRRRV